MPAVTQLRTSDLLQSSSSSSYQPSSSSSSSFSDALKTAQSKPDDANNPANTADSSQQSQLAIKPKSKHVPTHKSKKDAGNTQTADTDTPEDPQAALEKTPPTDTTDADPTKTAEAQPEEPCAHASQPNAADLAAVISQTTTIPTAQTAPVKKPLPPSGVATTSDQTAAAPSTDTSAPLKHTKDAPKPAEQPPQSGAAATPTADASPKKESVLKDKPDAANNPPEQLAISKPTKQQQEKTAAAKHDHEQQPSTPAQPAASTNAQSTAPLTADAPNDLSTVIAAEHEHDSPSAAQDTSNATVTTTHTSTHASTASADSAAEAQDSPPMDREQTFDQIILGLRGKIDARNGNAEIHLNPPNLGTVHVSINLDKGNLTAQFQSGSAEVRDLLKGHMEKLKTVLESSGVSVDKLTVESPTDVPAKSASSPQTGTANHDGRSAGEYTQDQRRKKSDEPSAFAKMWQAAPDQTPIDLVA